MKQQYVLIIIILMLAGSAYAYPNLNNQRVTDNANLLTSQQIQDLTTQIYSMENITGAQFAIVTVPNTEGDGRVDYASRIGQQNGVGQSGLDNGVVILWSVGDDHGGAIATGRGIGDILNDAKVSRIGRAHRAEFDNGQYYTAFSGILSDILNEFPNNQTNSTGLYNNSTGTTLPGWAGWLIAFGVIGFFIFLIIALNNDDGTGSGGFAGGYVGSSGGWSSGGSGGFSGGGFSGGGFGGGGGAF